MNSCRENELGSRRCVSRLVSGTRITVGIVLIMSLSDTIDGHRANKSISANQS